MRQDLTTEIALVQTGFFKPVLETLETAGAPVNRLLRHSGLDRFDLSDRENYVPVKLMYRLFDEIRRGESIDSIFAAFAPRIQVQSLSNWGETVAFTPDVLSACEFAIEFDNVLQTHERMHLEINGPISTMSQVYLDAPQPGRDFADQLNFCYLLSAFQLAGGGDWAPLEIHLQSSEPADFETLLPNNNSTRIYLSQPATAVVFPTAMLVAPMLGKASQASTYVADRLPQTLTQAIEQLLNSSYNARLANLRVIADMLDLSPRTLRRRLAESSTTFSEIVDSWRFKSSLDLLEQEHLQIGEIAQRLGYANTSNFDRAFQRWTGRSPRNYRDILAN